MIRGPVLPQGRDALWSLVATRLDLVERGLTLVAENFDCSGGQLGAADGLARDAAGAPVLVLLATDGDPLLAARALDAAAFLERVGDALATALPEAELCPGTVGRVLVVAADGAAAAVAALARMRVAGLHVCRLEAFRLDGTERFAVRWCASAPEPGAAPAAAPELALPPALQPLWDTVHALCCRIDAGIRIEGDRYCRRIRWRGRVLADVALADAGLVAAVGGGPPRPIATPGDVRTFVDQVLRGYAQAAGLGIAAAGGDGGAATRGPAGSVTAAAPARNGAIARAALRTAPESLRASLTATRLTAEEYSALGAPASSAGDTSGTDLAGDALRSPAHDGSWPAPERTD